MRQTMVGLAVAVAAMVSTAPASACGFYSSCGTPGWNYNYSGWTGNYSQPSCGLPSPCGYTTPWRYGHLSQTTAPYAVAPQYYYVNQGPTYTGPGLLAPAPTYQERAVGGWYGYGPTAYGPNYQYSGGPYSNATTHYYDGMPAAGTGVRYMRRHATMHRYMMPRMRRYAPLSVYN